MQKKSFNTKVIALLLCLILTLSMAFGLAGCTKDSTDSQSGTNVTQTLSGGVIGEGQTQFALAVVDADGNETNFEVCAESMKGMAQNYKNSLPKLMNDASARNLKVEQFTHTCEYLKMDESGATINNT